MVELTAGAILLVGGIAWAAWATHKTIINGLEDELDEANTKIASYAKAKLAQFKPKELDL